MSEKILDKVNKLFAMAESAGKVNSPFEAEKFAAQAQALLDKHNLSMSDAELHARRNEPIGFQVVPTETPCPFWQEVLCNGIATVNGCFQVAAAESGVLAISGRPQDRTITINFFKHFVTASKPIEKEFVQAYRTTLEFFQSGAAGLPNARDSFMFGYAVGIIRKLKETYRVDAQEAKNSEALVWLDGRHTESAKWMKENVPVQMEEGEPPTLDHDYVGMGIDAAADIALTDKILA